MYGSIQFDQLQYSPPITYQHISENTSISTIIELATTEIDYSRSGHLAVRTTQPVCKLLNVSNRLPIFVMSFSLFLLFILNTSMIVVVCVLVRKIKQVKIEAKHQHRMFFESRYSLHDNRVKELKLSNLINFKRDDYTLIKCIISIAIFSIIFNTPSLILRNFLMLAINFNQIETPGGQRFSTFSFSNTLFTSRFLWISFRMAWSSKFHFTSVWQTGSFAPVLFDAQVPGDDLHVSYYFKEGQIWGL